jgi:predicted PurR-regulated permease PerM
MNSITKKTITVLLIILAFFLFFKFFLRLFLPFLIAFVFATLFHKPIKSFSQRTGIKIRILSAVLVIGAVLVISFIVFWVSNRALNEAERFAISVSENSDRYVAAFFGFLDTVAEKIPFIEASGEDLSETVALSIRNMFSSWAARLPGVIARMIGMLPEILLFTIFFLL